MLCVRLMDQGGLLAEASSAKQSAVVLQRFPVGQSSMCKATSKDATRAAEEAGTDFEMCDPAVPPLKFDFAAVKASALRDLVKKLEAQASRVSAVGPRTACQSRAIGLEFREQGFCFGALL